MAEADRRYRYVAIGPSGRRQAGDVVAPNEQSAFAQLKRDGLAPIRIRSAPRGSAANRQRRVTLTDRESADLLADLAALLKAGSDLRTALSILGARSGRSAVTDLCKAVSSEISGGGALDAAFARVLPLRFVFVGALIAAGEASGDLPGGLQRSADMLEAQIKLREQLVSALSYPTFVLISTVVAFLIIVFFLVPSLAPLAESGQSEPPLMLRVLLGFSMILRNNLGLIGAALIAMLAALVLAARTGVLSSLADRALLNGPAKGVTGAIVFGGFAIALGDMLAAGAPMSGALRLATRSVRSATARARLEPVTTAVREGQPLSSALERVTGLPNAIVRLAAVGEASGALGIMLARGGRIEEQTALRKIESAGRILGPAMILLLGGMIGLLMAGLLTSIQQVGDMALQ